MEGTMTNNIIKQMEAQQNAMNYEQGKLDKNILAAKHVIESKTIYEIPGFRYAQNQLDLWRKPETTEMSQKE